MNTGIVFGYSRVSTENQRVEGFSLEDQQIRVRGFYESVLKASGLRWGEIFQDGGVSGDTPFMDRPAGKQLYQRLKRGDHVIMTRLDRGFRNLRDFLEVTEKWLKSGIYIHMLDMGGGMSIDTSTPQGELMYTLFAAIAQMMRRIIKENTMNGMRRRKEKYGFANHMHPIGTKNVGSTKFPKIVPFVEERRQMALICHLVEDLRVPIEEIVKMFKHNNFEITPGGSLWTYARLVRGITAYIREGMTDPCCEFPPPPDRAPYRRKLRGKKSKPRPLGDAPAAWCSLIQVTDSTIPFRVMRSRFPEKEPSLPALLPGQVVPRKRFGLRLQREMSGLPLDGPPKARRTPVYEVLNQTAECDAQGPPSSTTGCSTSSPPPTCPTSSST